MNDISRRTFLAAGVVGGLAALIRGPLLLLPLVFPLYRLLAGMGRRVVVRDAACMWLGVALVMAPWAWRNHRVLGSAVVSATQGGPSLFRGFHPLAGRYFTNIGWQQLLEQSGGDELRVNKLGWRRGMQFIIDDPPGAVVRVFRKWQRLLESDHEVAGHVFDTPSGPFSTSSYRRARSAACGLSDVWYAWLSLCTWFAAVSALRKRRGDPFLIWPLLALATGLAVFGLFEAQPRYMVMYHCFWVVLAALTLNPHFSPRESQARNTV